MTEAPASQPCDALFERHQFGLVFQQPIPSVLAIALDLASLGLKVFFLSRRKTTMKDSHGHLDATSDRDELIALYWKYQAFGPPAFVGYAMGANGVAVLDFDFKHPEALAWYEANGRYLPSTFTYRSRSGGLHHVFKEHPKARLAIGCIETGVDVKAGSSYCVAWFAHGFKIENLAPTASWPDWLDIPEGRAETRRQRAAEPAIPCPQRVARPRGDLPPICAAILSDLDMFERPEGIEEGARDDTLMRYAGSCFGRGMAYEETLADCLACNDTFDPPMTDEQVAKIVKSIGRKHARQQEQRRADHGFLQSWYYRR